jgi:antitoxin component of MazEF toxin-antitoxin module
MTEKFGRDIRKIIRVGESAAITVPQQYMQEHGLKIGDKVELNFDGILNIEPIDENDIRRKLGKKVGTRRLCLQAERVEP